MSKKKVSVKKKTITINKENKSYLSWFFYALGVLVILAALFFLYNGITGNAFRSFGFGDIQSAAYQIQPVVQFFLGGGYDGQFLFERFLLFIVVLSMVFVVLKTSVPLFSDPKHKNIVVLLSVIVAILSIRFIDYQWLSTALMSYSILGIALISFLPFIIYFFFLMKSAPNNSTVRKIGWIFFACIYFGLYFSSDNESYGSVYIWTGLAALAFLFADGTIARAMAKQRIEFGASMNAVNKIADIDGQITSINSSGLTVEQKKKSIENLYKQRRFWEKHLS